MPSERLVFGFHAIQRMYLRGISVGDVRQVVATGEVVEEYPDDMPYPSKLLLGWRGGKPLHIVAARNRER